jgi:hypothetical protein
MDKLEIIVNAKCSALSHECVATFVTSQGQQASLYVDHSLLRFTEHETYMQVYAHKPLAEHSGDSIRVLLPSEAFELESRWADVPTPVHSALEMA